MNTLSRSRPVAAPLRSLGVAAFYGALVGWGCGPKQPPPKPPVAPAAEPEAEVTEEAEPEAPPPKVGEDAFSIGTFNLDWAYDSLGDRRPKSAKANVAPDDESWEWKRDRIVEVLVAEQLDVVALIELGGERELTDIISSVSTTGGPDYNYAWLPSEDRLTGQQVAILSRFPVSNERRTDAYLPKHIAADIELPTGDAITVIAMHLPEGKNKGATNKRRKMATSIKRRANKQASSRPVIMLGTVGARTTPFDDDYNASAAGLLAGQGNRKQSDDCEDSASESLARATTVGAGEPVDRIFVCGLDMRGAETSSEELVVREQEDPPKTPWPSTAVAEEPHRDVSDHVVLWAEVVMPAKPEPEPEPDAAAEGGAGGDPSPSGDAE